MTGLRSVSDYEREIHVLDEMIAQQQQSVDELDFASQLNLHSLTQLRQSLIDQMMNLGDEGMPAHQLSVLLEGAAVRRHEIEADFLGTVLQSLQSLVRSMVGATTGTAGRKGPHTNKVKRISTLRFAGSFAGSFGMKLEAVDEQLELDNTLPLAPTFERLVALFSHGRNVRHLLDDLAPLGARPAGNYRELLEKLADWKADMTVVWPSVEGDRQATIRASEASVVVEVLRRIEEEVTTEWLTGELIGASKRRGTFEFQTDDEQVLLGWVDIEIIDSLKDYFGRRCKAWMLVRTISDKGTGDRRTAYQLQQLAPAGDDEILLS